MTAKLFKFLERHCFDQHQIRTKELGQPPQDQPRRVGDKTLRFINTDGEIAEIEFDETEILILDLALGGGVREQCSTLFSHQEGQIVECFQ
jgi:hypothetical protein